MQGLLQKYNLTEDGQNKQIYITQNYKTIFGTKYLFSIKILFILNVFLFLHSFFFLLTSLINPYLYVYTDKIIIYYC